MRNINILLFDDAPNGAGLPSRSIVKKQIWMWLLVFNAKYKHFRFAPVWFWFGLVWAALVWAGLVWAALVWAGLVWAGLVWAGCVWE